MRRVYLAKMYTLTTYSRIVEGIPPLRFAPVGMTEIGAFVIIDSLVKAGNEMIV